MTTPPLPPGFVLEGPDSGATPPLPPGFVPESGAGDGGAGLGDLRHSDGRLTEAGWQAERDSLSQRDPLEGTGLYSRYAAGLGVAGRRLFSGARQLLTDTAAVLPEAPGMLPPREVRQEASQRLREREGQRRQDEAPILDHWAGQAGNIIGTVGALFTPAAAARGTAVARALLPRSVRGNVAHGAAFGAAQPVAEEGERAGNIAMGAGAAGAGAAVANRVLSRFTPQARAAMGDAERLGVNLRGTPGEQVTQTAEAARRLVPVERGEAMPAVQEGVQAARQTAREGVDAAYDAARATQASVPMGEVQGFSAGARRALSERGFDLESPQLSGVSRLLNQLEDFSATPQARSAQLRALEDFRKRINAMSPRDGSPAMAASTALKRQYDDWMTDLFNRDMIQGDQAALQAWQEARGAAAQFKATFDSNRVIQSLARDRDATPETMRAWLFNASGSGAKPQAGAVVGRLNSILGPDSPQMNSLRAEVVADLSEPLLQRTPNITTFLNRYDTYFRRNPTLLKNLFPEGAGDLASLERFARGIEKRPGAKIPPTASPDQRTFWGPLGRLLTAKIWGHGIAEGGARMAAARSFIGRARSATLGSAARKNLLREYLGTDPVQPMFPGTGPAAAIGQQSRRDAADSGVPVQVAPLPE